MDNFKDYIGIFSYIFNGLILFAEIHLLHFIVKKIWIQELDKGDLVIAFFCTTCIIGFGFLLTAGLESESKVLFHAASPIYGIINMLIVMRSLKTLDILAI